MVKRIFVVQKHFAKNLHWDFRLELDGVLKSWVVPKEPSNEANIKRLAISTEDHDLSYADFEGVIPEGQYGAGVVKIWDKGTYNLVDRKDFKLIVELKGEKMQGKYYIVHMKDKQWLIFKKNESL